MDLGTLKSNSRKKKKRVGRGNGSGLGKTCGRGGKGQTARSGGKVAAYFEGGQMPLYRRMPIRGFNNARFKKSYQIVDLSQLNRFEANQEVTPELLEDAKIIEQASIPVKILANGEIKKALKISVHKCSKSAEEKIVKAGGTVVRL